MASARFGGLAWGTGQRTPGADFQGQAPFEGRSVAGPQRRSFGRGWGKGRLQHRPSGASRGAPGLFSRGMRTGETEILRFRFPP